MLTSFNDLISKVKGLPLKKVAIAASNDVDTIKLAHLLREKQIAQPILIGKEREIEENCLKLGFDHKWFESIPEETDLGASKRAVACVKSGQADFVMKGLVQTALFLTAVLEKEKGLRTDKLISEITVAEMVQEDRLLLVSDCAINIIPDLNTKVKIINNAIEAFRIIGSNKPQIALLASIELINSEMPETLDAAVICKMAERGQIQGAIIDGPLALDNILSKEASEHKGIKSSVAGQADVIIVPDLKTGNVLHKAMVFLANFQVASLIWGTEKPIVMTSRSDRLESKILSVALASLSASS